ncbi:bifunctional 2-polyprenyl-6-hydroxyphenol methylase/3-demethylubiquinol 3-O-methyltransferase UbiG [Cryobacterium sp. TMT1-66-1]|uniref:class I SAM-dependent methyltransferase n=1 Tax=Cryobacterium sp. TMT1-66-1 TaxID=1259242 RepID=UPI001F543CC2|nr:class I SAM-dependent methyltransferase [Cryobacterium sp. TMT1-66-1]
MKPNLQFATYAAKMRQHIIDGTDLEVDARFVDMLARRGSTILDIGCGHGSAVNGLRARGHAAFGIDPTREVLGVAFDNFDSDWFRELGVEGLSPERLARVGIPDTYDVVLMAGNVAAFLSGDALRHAFAQVSAVLKPGGIFVVGTSSHSRGGPHDQDDARGGTGLRLMHRFSDWHLGQYSPDSAWSVSVYTAPGESTRSEIPDGIFVLK